MDARLSQLLEELPNATPAEFHERVCVEFPEATRMQIKNKVKRLRSQTGEQNDSQSGAESVESLVAAGKLYSALVVLDLASSLDKALTRAPAALREMVLDGIHSEVVDGALALREIPEKGLGYIASRDLVAGSVLLFDTAFACTNDASSTARNAFHALEKAERFPEFFQGSILTLHGGNLSVFQSEVPADAFATLTDIIDANQFQITRAEEYAALFPAASRFNHSCVPNAVLDSLPEFAVVRAVRSIKKGEEVTLSYLPTDSPYDERQEKLRERGFACDCVRCSEDRQADPQEMLPCICRQKWFRAHRGADTRDGEHCEACGFMFDFKDARKRLDRIEVELHFMQTHEAQAADPRILAERLTKTIDFARRDPGAVPLTNARLSAVVMHLSSCYFFAAKRLGGGASAWNEYYRFRVMSLDAMEARYPGEVPPLIEYVRSLYRFVHTVKWPSKAEQKKWEGKYAHACQVMFGQKVIPPAVVSNIMLE